ncbi:hypothetical protein EDD22DRAFT_343551 [Suillus occidentalis]|nr:hypothetical protein EDD22DRAFT_343551 [Suillus occidentalis]
MSPLFCPSHPLTFWCLSFAHLKTTLLHSCDNESGALLDLQSIVDCPIFREIGACHTRLAKYVMCILKRGAAILHNLAWNRLTTFKAILKASTSLLFSSAKPLHWVCSAIPIIHDLPVTSPQH